MTARILVVTGTDTGVGKTLVTRALGASLAARGRRVVAIKPVESGCGGGEPEDGRLLAAATGQAAPTEALVRLRAPVAPPVAADEEGVELEPAGWLAAVRDAANDADPVLVEGAGGLLSPLAWDATILDLAAELAGELIVVAANRLGCLNHTALTASVARDRGVPVLATVLSDADEDATDVSRARNAAALHRTLPSVPVFELPRASDLDAARAFLAGLYALVEKTS